MEAFLNALKSELKFLFSGKGMPYEKVCLLVAMVVTVILSVLLSGNFAKDAKVVVIDLDNSAYTRELITRIDASEYMQVTAVINTPTDPKKLFYQDKAVAVLYFPRDLEKNRFTGSASNIGIFYDNTNTAQTANIKEAMNELLALDNAAAQGDVGSTNDSVAGQVQLADRRLFNPQESTSNTETLGFLFFFGSMFFTFATIGMGPRLRLTHEMDPLVEKGTPWEIIARILPYACCLIVSFVAGMAVLRVWGDLNVSGSLVAFLFTQVFYVLTVGMLSVSFGWTAANPGIASSRMILFIPGGFILGGMTGPVTYYSDWVVHVSHVFPLTWEFHFQRDIIARGAGISDISALFGAFLVYMTGAAALLCWRFYGERRKHYAQKRKEERAHQKMQAWGKQMAQESALAAGKEG